MVDENNSQNEASEEDKAKEELQAKNREAALFNLSNDNVIVQLALPGMVRGSGLLSDTGNGIVANQIYSQVFDGMVYQDGKTGEKRNFMAELIGSKMDGESYSQMNRQISGRAMQMMNEYMPHLKVNDILSLQGISNVNYKPEYSEFGDRYISSFSGEGVSDAEKEFAQGVIGGYHNNFMFEAVLGTFQKMREDGKKGLEGYLSAPPQPANSSSEFAESESGQEAAA